MRLFHSECCWYISSVIKNINPTGFAWMDLAGLFICHLSSGHHEVRPKCLWNFTSALLICIWSESNTCSLLFFLEKKDLTCLSFLYIYYEPILWHIVWVIFFRTVAVTSPNFHIFPRISTESCRIWSSFSLRFSFPCVSVIPLWGLWPSDCQSLYLSLPEL